MDPARGLVKYSVGTGVFGHLFVMFSGMDNWMTQDPACMLISGIRQHRFNMIRTATSFEPGVSASCGHARVHIPGHALLIDV